MILLKQNEIKKSYHKRKFIILFMSILRGNIPDYQAASLLMAIFLNGMSEKEILDLTLEMAHSGSMVDLSQIPGIKVDKHSTGGIGDKVTMVVMPLVASLGVPVAKMSGRGLGYTQGTTDKLDSIPGFRTNLDMDEFVRNVKRIGISIMCQSENIAIADKKLYSLRDVTGTVESIPLIASSVMSKKLASGADKILLEVTYGSGAFMENEQRARVLAQTMVKIGNNAGKETIAVLTNMNQPLGRFVGNALETKETIDILGGHGECDITNVCLLLGAYMLKLAQRGENIVSNMKLLQEQINNGQGLAKFKEFVSRQWGESRVVDEPEILMKAKYKIPVNSIKTGYISAIEAKNMGQAVVNLGGGRLKKEDEIDYYVGLEVLKKIGDKVQDGEPLLYIYANDETKGLMQVEFLRNSYSFSDEPVAKPKEVLDVIE